MASTGDDSDTGSPASESSSSEASADAGAENDVNKLEQGRQDPQNEEPRPVSNSADEDEDSEDYDRENRFHGSSSTWRYFTENERSLAKSLDQQRANDLSIALYNVHALKTQVRDSEAPAKVKQYHFKKRWLKLKEDGTLPWQPRVRWAAWPLRPDRVPRSGERFGVSAVPDGLERYTYKKVEPWKPSGHLEEEILAFVMRKAKERLRDTGWRDQSTSVDQAETVG